MKFILYGLSAVREVWWGYQCEGDDDYTLNPNYQLTGPVKLTWRPSGYSGERHEWVVFAEWVTLDPTHYKWLGTNAKDNYDLGRLSSPPPARRASPGDGRLVFPNGYGGEFEHWVDHHDGTCTLLVEYHPGPEDLRFVAECDRDYLNTLLWGPERRILPNVFPDTTKLRDTEPGVWLLWLRANCPPDIGTWYMAQLELPNIQELVEAADKECKDWSETQKTQYEQSAREAQAKAARLTQLRAKLTTLIPAVMEALKPLEAKKQLILLPATELSGLQKFMSNLTTLQPQALDEAQLTEAIRELETWQPYVNSLPAKIAAEQETRHRLAELRTKLQALLSKAARILDPIEARNEIQVLPIDEQSILRDFSAHIRSLQPSTLDEISLNREIAFIKDKRIALDESKKKITAIIALQQERDSFEAKAREAVHQGKYNVAFEIYSYLKTCYEKLVALGIDCGKQLQELEPKIQEAEIIKELNCRIILYSELKFDEVKLGVGIFGTVLRGFWAMETLAIKKLYVGQVTAKAQLAFLKAFVEEVNIMQKLDSERLVRLFGVCLDPYCIAMEYMPKGSLYSLIHSAEQFNWQILLQIAIDIGSGLHFLHAEGIIHRNLKSLNVLIDSYNRAKICDFGLARVKNESASKLMSKNVVGTMAYLAPELLTVETEGEVSYTYTTDMYAYGIVLWEIQTALLEASTRKDPFSGLNPARIIARVIQGKRPEIPQTCPPVYRETIERCWAQLPGNRPKALEVLQVLQAELAKTSLKAWHIEPSLKPSGENAAGYYLIPAGVYDTKKVVEYYQRCPVPGMEVARVKIIFNPTLEKSFATTVTLLEQQVVAPDVTKLILRYEALQARATITGDTRDCEIATWRMEVLRQLEIMAQPYQDPEAQHVKLLPVWHGTKKDSVAGIAQAGYANLAITDVGFFGKGLYGSYEAEYAYRLFGPGVFGADGVLLMNWVSCYAAYPVVGYEVRGYTGIAPDDTDGPGDILKLRGGYSFENFDAHFVPVRPSKINPEACYYPCRPHERATYHEVVVFGKSQILPRYIVELQPTLVAAPAVTPLLAAMGIFGAQQEQQEGTAPALVPR